MRYGSIQLAERKVAGTATPTFMYFFTYALGGWAGHGYEIAFHFDNVATEYGHASPSRQRLAEEMSEAWLAFAHNGDPAHPGLPDWPAYELDGRATMIFARDGSFLDCDPAGPARQLWERVLARPTR